MFNCCKSCCPVIIAFQDLCGVPVADSHYHLRSHVVMHDQHPTLNCKKSGSVSCPRLPESPQWVKPITTANYLESIPEPWRKLETTFPLWPWLLEFHASLYQSERKERDKLWKQQGALPFNCTLTAVVRLRSVLCLTRKSAERNESNHC